MVINSKASIFLLLFHSYLKFLVYLSLLVFIYFVPGRSGHVSVTPRAGHLVRPTSPKSPVASASAFESVEGSDDEDNMTDASKLDTTYLHTNGETVSNVTYIKHLLMFISCLLFMVLLAVVNMENCFEFRLCSKQRLLFSFSYLVQNIVQNKYCFSFSYLVQNILN